MMNKASMRLKLAGHTRAFRDAEVELRNEATGESLKRKPFADGTLTVPNLDPGLWNVVLKHPNLTTPLWQNRVRVFPDRRPTVIPIPVPDELFLDNPIRDVPDADLSPVQEAAAASRSGAQAVAGKASGEAIRASDWNTLTEAVSGLADAVLELTRLVAPRGHDHPEIADKIEEVQGNLRRFADAYGKSLLAIKREIETQKLRRDATEALDRGRATPDVRRNVLDRIEELEKHTESNSLVFTRKLSQTGAVLLSTINDLSQNEDVDADAFLAEESVKNVQRSARAYFEAGTQGTPESELQTYFISGTNKLTGLVGGF